MTIYYDDFIEPIKKALEEEGIKGELAEKILKFIDELYELHIPIFNGLVFVELQHSKAAPLTMLLKSQLKGIDYNFKIEFNDDEFFLYEERGRFRINDNDSKLIIQTVCGDDLVIFIGTKAKEDVKDEEEIDEEEDSNEEDIKDEEESGYDFDNISLSLSTYITKVCDYKRHTYDYGYEFEFDDNGEFKTDFMKEFVNGADKFTKGDFGSIDDCILAMMYFRRYIYKNYIDLYEPMIKKKTR